MTIVDRLTAEQEMTWQVCSGSRVPWKAEYSNGCKSRSRKDVLSAYNWTFAKSIFPGELMGILPIQEVIRTRNRITEDPAMPAVVQFPTVVNEAIEEFGDLFANEPERIHFAEYLTVVAFPEDGWIERNPTGEMLDVVAIVRRVSLQFRQRQIIRVQRA